MACSEPSGPVAAARDVVRPSADIVVTEIDRVVIEEKFAIADKDPSIGICVKGTSSTHVLMKDANSATPSQPCPPAWEYLGKPAGIKIRKEWFSEDKNAHGQVCVKFVGRRQDHRQGRQRGDTEPTLPGRVVPALGEG